jgi:predicted aspartyl protease
LTFVRANRVATISVGDQSVQAIVDTGGDGAFTLSEVVIERVGGVKLSGTLVTTIIIARDDTYAKRAM